jgi:protein-disulfide isomerase
MSRPSPTAVRFPLPALALALLLTTPVLLHGQDDLAALGYSRGDASAPVTVVEFGDFGCSSCRQFALESYPAIHEEFVATGKVRWVYVPFLLGVFPNATEAARAAECAAEQDAFWPLHDLLFERQEEWKRPRNPSALLQRYASELKLDQARFTTCYREDHGRARTRANNRAARRNGVRATPTFFVNGKRLEGAPPTEQFRQLLVLSGAR